MLVRVGDSECGVAVKGVKVVMAEVAQPPHTNAKSERINRADANTNCFIEVDVRYNARQESELCDERRQREGGGV